MQRGKDTPVGQWPSEQPTCVDELNDHKWCDRNKCNKLLHVLKIYYLATSNIKTSITGDITNIITEEVDKVQVLQFNILRETFVLREICY